MTAFVPFHSLSEAIAHGKHDFSAHQLKVALTNTAPDVETDTMLSDIDEITYDHMSSRDVTTLSSASVGSKWTLKLDNLQLTVTDETGPVRYVVLYDDDTDDKLLVAVRDRGNSITLMAGEKLDLLMDEDGIFFIEPKAV